MWAVPFIGVLAKIRRWRAIFIAPTNGVFNSIRRPETGALNM